MLVVNLSKTDIGLTLEVIETRMMSFIIRTMFKSAHYVGNRLKY